METRIGKIEHINYLGYIMSSVLLKHDWQAELTVYAMSEELTFLLTTPEDLNKCFDFCCALCIDGYKASKREIRDVLSHATPLYVVKVTCTE